MCGLLWGGEGKENDEAQREWARSGGQSTSLSAATPEGSRPALSASELSGKGPAAWRCCRWLSGICDRPIVAIPMASPASVTIDGGAHLSLWTTGHGGETCRGRVVGT